MVLKFLKLSVMFIAVLFSLSSVFADTINYDLSTLDSVNDAVGYITTSTYDEVNDRIVLDFQSSGYQELIWGDIDYNDSVRLNFENNIENYTGDLNSLNEYTVTYNYNMTGTGAIQGTPTFSLISEMAYNGASWSMGETQMNFGAGTINTFFYHDLTLVNDQLISTFGDTKVEYSVYINKNTEELTMTYYYPTLMLTHTKTYNLTAFVGSANLDLTDMWFYTYTNYNGNVHYFSDFTLSSPEIDLTPEPVVEQGFFGGFLSDIGSGLGAFLNAITSPLVYFIIVLGIGGSITALITAIVGRIKKQK